MHRAACKKCRRNVPKSRRECEGITQPAAKGIAISRANRRRITANGSDAWRRMRRVARMCQICRQHGRISWHGREIPCTGADIADRAKQRQTRSRTRTRCVSHVRQDPDGVTDVRGEARAKISSRGRACVGRSSRSCPGRQGRWRRNPAPAPRRRCSIRRRSSPAPTPETPS